MKVRGLSAKLANTFQEGDFGIEVEVEGYNLPHLDNKYWTAIHDGSLRGESFEYITKGAIPFKDIRKVMNYLNAKFREKGSELHLSFRTSVHIHMNVLDVEMEKLATIVYLYYLFEEPLVEFCGDVRIGNRFCLRLSDAEAIVDNIRVAFQQNGLGFKNIRNDYVKYAALNIGCVPRFGSLEFRSMKGTVDTDTITQWVTLLNCLKNNPFNNVKEAYEFLQDNGPQKLGEAVFEEHLRFIEFPGFANNVMRNASLLIELPYELKFEEVKARPVNEALDFLQRAYVPPPVAFKWRVIPNVPDGVLIVDDLQHRPNMDPQYEQMLNENMAGER